jgi:ABC-type hemin transport system ATPase subunit
MIYHIRILDNGKDYASRKNENGTPENPELYKNIVERSFEFQEDKVNLIFGPNRSGKTTLIRAIGGYAGCLDGFTKPIKYLDKNKDIEEQIQKNYHKLAQNEAILDWDGAPVYYENFRDTMMNRNYGSIGDMAGSLFNDTEEIGFIMNRTRISAGQMSMVFLNQLIKKIQQGITWDEILGGADKEHLRFHKELGKEGKGLTILFDECETSFDIQNQWLTIRSLFPNLIKKCGCQVIAVSHNPFILSDKIFCNPEYNIISVEPEYTQKTRNLIKKIYEVDVDKETVQEKE